MPLRTRSLTGDVGAPLLHLDASGSALLPTILLFSPGFSPIVVSIRGKAYGVGNLTGPGCSLRLAEKPTDQHTSLIVGHLKPLEGVMKYYQIA